MIFSFNCSTHAKQEKETQKVEAQNQLSSLKRYHMGANFQVSNTIQVPTQALPFALKRTQKSEGKNYTRHHEEKRSHNIHR